MKDPEKKYLERLSELYPTIAKASTEIINTIIRTRRADVFIVALAELIPKLTVDHLHILGDIFDRGSGSIVEQKAGVR